MSVFQDAVKTARNAGGREGVGVARYFKRLLEDYISEMGVNETGHSRGKLCRAGLGKKLDSSLYASNYFLFICTKSLKCIMNFLILILDL